MLLSIELIQNEISHVDYPAGVFSDKKSGQ